MQTKQRGDESRMLHWFCPGGWRLLVKCPRTGRTESIAPYTNAGRRYDWLSPLWSIPVTASPPFNPAMHGMKSPFPARKGSRQNTVKNRNDK